MRLTILASAALSCLASARLAIAGNQRGSVVEATGKSAPDAANGWTPKPTDAPGKSPSGVALDLLKRRDSEDRKTTNTWLNDKTCGWYTGAISAPFTCDPGYTCATEYNVVGCTNAASATLWRACYDYNALQRGDCDNVGLQTGCCMTSTFGACATFLWQGETPASMFRCVEKPTIIMMRTAPVLLSTTTIMSTSVVMVTHTSTVMSVSTSKISTTISPSASSQAPLAPRHAGGSSNGRERIGVIIGAVLGSVVALICIFFVVIVVVLRRDPQWRANMYGNKVETAPSPAPAYSADDLERVEQERPQTFQLEKVKGRALPPA
ncbi:hypothetical protein B0T14DRAFT_496233 [Immersiella caudata]|uniref:Uncharacterized protein n=1 Tax=Immersiella caudata TaxID=314043 RepID=A0AA39WQ25_9PEZI|nr:hypothetical protein B0T14DRAFT_496233 [Immersiella caudata]